jgi:general secretion pathway protein G
MLRRSHRNAAGFTLLEIVVAVAMIGMLAAVLTPQVLSRTTMAQGATLLSTLTGLEEAATAHRGDVGRFPQSLRQLATAPTTGVRDLCGRQIPGLALESWSGPYLDRSVATTGIEIGGSVISNTLRRSPATYSEVGTLYIDVAGVDEGVAEQMDRALDGTLDFASGSILWADVGASGRGTLSLAVPVRGC